MKEAKTEYVVINVFANNRGMPCKEKVNAAIRTLCILDLEKICNLNYNTSVAFHGGVSDYEKGGALLKC